MSGRPPTRSHSAGEGPGIPLPAGTVRVYKRDSDGSTHFVGEDRIDHTPVDEPLMLKLGNAFDVAAERRQTEYRVLSKCLHESGFEVKVRNHKKEEALVDVIEPAGGDWEILSHSHDYEKVDSSTIKFKIAVPPGEEAVLTYRVRVKYC